MHVLPLDLQSVSVPTRFDLKLGMLGVTLACKHGCRKCLSDAKPNGEQMPFELVQRIPSLGLEFDQRGISFSIGEPLLYLRDGKDLGDVICVLAPHVPFVGILTGGIDLERDPHIRQVLLKLREFRFKVAFTVSFDLIDREYAQVLQSTSSTIRVLIEQDLQITHLSTQRINGDEIGRQKTRELSLQIIDSFNFSPEIFSFSLVDAIGRARSIPGVHERLVVDGEDDCSAIGDCVLDTERRIGVLPNGDLLPCTKNASPRVEPFGNLFKDSPSELQTKYREYVLGLLKLRGESDPRRMLCYLHMERAMKAKTALHR